MQRYQQRQCLFLFGIMILLAATFFPSFGTWDILTWIRWGDNVEKFGLIDGYAKNQHEHPPLMSAFFLLSYQLADVLGLHRFYGIKLGFLLCLFASTFTIYRWSSRNIEITFCFYLALLFSCLSLSYLDIYFAPFVLLSIFFLQRQNVMAALSCFAIASLIKYPPLMIAPFLAVYVLSQLRLRYSEDNRLFVQSVMIALLPAIFMLTLVCAVFGDEPVKALVRAFRHGDLSANALNFNWVITRVIQIFLSGKDVLESWNNDAELISAPPQWSKVLARLLFWGFYLSCFVRFLYSGKTLVNFLLVSICAHMSYFMFSIGVHENHLFLSTVLAMALVCLDSRFSILAINLCLISSMNLFAFHGYNGVLPDFWRGTALTGWEGENAWLNGGPPLDFRLLFAIFNVLYFFVFWVDVIVHKRGIEP